MQVQYKFLAVVDNVIRLDAKPSWRAFKRYGIKDADVTPQPPLSDLGDGYWGWTWDAAKAFDVYGDILLNIPGVTHPPIEQESTREAGVILMQSGYIPAPQSPTPIPHAEIQRMLDATIETKSQIA